MNFFRQDAKAPRNYLLWIIPWGRVSTAAGYAHIEQAAGQLRVFGAEDHTADVARTLVGAGLDLNELTAVHEDLEAHFLRLTGSVR